MIEGKIKTAFPINRLRYLHSISYDTETRHINVVSVMKHTISNILQPKKQYSRLAIVRSMRMGEFPSLMAYVVRNNIVIDKFNSLRDKDHIVLKLRNVVFLDMTEMRKQEVILRRAIEIFHEEIDKWT